MVLCNTGNAQINSNVQQATIVQSFAPPSNFIGSQGQFWVDRSTTPATVYQYIGNSWIVAGNSTTLTVTTDSGVATVAGNNINIVGADGTSTSGTGATVTVTSTEADFSSPPPIGDVTPNTIEATQLTTDGTGLVTLSSSGAASITGAVDVDITATTGTVTVTGDTNVDIVATTDSVNITAEEDFVVETTSGSVDITSGSTMSVDVTGALNITVSTHVGIDGGNLEFDTAGSGILINNSPTATGAAASPVIVNGRTGAAIFTSVSIAAAADLTLTITNSAITAATTQVIYSMSGATTGSALSIKSVTNSAGSSAIVVTNGTGATTSTADITLTFIVINE